MLFKTSCSLLMLAFLALTQFHNIETPAPLKRDALPQSPVPKASAGIELLTDPEGVDFNACLRELYLSIRKNWYANMPASVEKGNQGVNSVQFHVLRDGNVPKDSVELLYHSGKSDLDAASLQAIREAAPFGHLPEKFSQPFIALRVTFYYNVAPKRP
jgi:TonB family protein